MSEPARILIANALVQITFTAWFGGWLLYRLHLAKRRSGMRDLVAAHVDWVILGLVQVAVAYASNSCGAHDVTLPAALLAVAGWLNPVPYLARGAGVNAFEFGGSRLQRVLAAVGAMSVVCLTLGLTWITIAVLRAG